MRLDPSASPSLVRQDSLCGPWPVSHGGLPRIGWAWALALHGAALGLGLGALIPAPHVPSPAGEVAVFWAPAPASAPDEAAAGPEARDGSAPPEATPAEVASAGAIADLPVEPMTAPQDAAVAAPAPEVLAAPLPVSAPAAPPQVEPVAEEPAPLERAAEVPVPAPSAPPSAEPAVDQAPPPVPATQPSNPTRPAPSAPTPTRRAAPVRQANLALPPDNQRRRGDLAGPLGTATPAGATAAEGPVVPASAPAALLPDSYKAMLGALLRRGLRYPPSARDRDEEGDVIVAFSVARDGTVRGARVVRSSGVSALDQEALALLARISPVPPLPAGWAAAEAAFVVPVRFQLR